jgi:hypothetical protein
MVDLLYSLFSLYLSFSHLIQRSLKWDPRPPGDFEAFPGTFKVRTDRKDAGSLSILRGHIKLHRYYLPENYSSVTTVVRM